MQVVTLPDEVKGFVGLDHELLVGFGQVFRFDHHNLLLFELHIATGCDNDPVLAWVVLFTAFLGLSELFFEFEIS